MRTKGKLITWNDEKGFGFIQPALGGKQVFIHIKAFRNRNRRPDVGQVVTYSLSSGQHGRPCAERATLTGDSLPVRAKQDTNMLAVFISVIFIIFVIFNVILTKTSIFFLYFYIAISLLTFIFYYYDKSAAKKGTWRTSESSLHILSLIGGWPGAIIAQQKLRHKSKKQSFLYMFWATAFINFCAFAWALSSEKSETLQTIIRVIN